MVLVVLIYGGMINYVYWMQCKFAAKQTYVFLAIDIPKNILQTPRAVENIFTAMAGAQQPLDWHEKYLFGEFQLGYSLEIVSIDGFIQFIIRTPSQFRNLVEASVYSQYPEAEITEVHDYTAEINVSFPSDEYNLWGADLVLVKPDYYPIKTYKEFQEELDNEFKDPMAALLEVMSTIGPGEQIWFQLMIAPADIGWESTGVKAVNKIIGIEEKYKKNVLDYISDVPLKALEIVGDSLFSSEGKVAEQKKDEKFNMMFLDPIKKREVETILQKVDKNCFMCKLRYVYFGKREVFKKGLGVSGVMGAIKQFGVTGLNAFKPGKNKTQAKLFLKKPRMSVKQNLMLKNFKKRNPDTCKGKYLLSVEELATLFHFPYIEVKAPMVKKIESKKGHAPIGLPVEEKAAAGEVEEIEAPTPLEFGEKVPVVDFDNDYFEERFAVDKSGQSDKIRKQQLVKKLEEAGILKATKTDNNNDDQDDAPPFNVENKIDSEDGDQATPSNLPFA